MHVGCAHITLWASPQTLRNKRESLLHANGVDAYSKHVDARSIRELKRMP
jgi:hypothetical protein